MKKIRCELCESLNVVKENDLYVCKECGTSYTLEQAKKLLVEVEGEAYVDTNQVEVKQTENKEEKELENLFIVARRAFSGNDYTFAAKCYGDILMKCPNNWEATFYQTFSANKKCKIAEIGIKNVQNKNAALAAMDLAISNLKTEEEIIKVLNEILLVSCNNAILGFSGVQDWYNSSPYAVRGNFTAQMLAEAYPCVELLYSVADKASPYIDKDEKLKKNITDSWKRAVEFNIKLVKFSTDKEKQRQIIYKYKEKIRKYCPYYSIAEKEYNAPNYATSKHVSDLSGLETAAKVFAIFPIGIIISLVGLGKTNGYSYLASSRKTFKTTLTINIISTILFVIIYSMIIKNMLS